jgi:Predicted multitransmembrane protein
MKNHCINKLPMIIIIAILLTLNAAKPVQADSNNQSNVLVWAKVVKIISQERSASKLANNDITTQTLVVKLTSGKFHGRMITVTNTIGMNPVFDVKVSEGDGVVVALDIKNGRIKDAGIADHLREPSVYLLIAIFILLLLIVGWKKGLKALITLLLTLALVLGVLLPGILHGYEPVMLTLTLAFVLTVTNTLIVGGFSKKSLTTIIGTFGGLMIAGVIALKIGKAASLTGLGNEESAMLLYLPKNVHLNVQGVLFAGIIIGTLGAVMDVSMSVASAVEEVKRVNPALNLMELFRSGMNVGRDIMGIMANTLILAYTGSSVSLLLIFMAYHNSLTQIINLDMIASEIVRALSGSIGMILVVPITALVAAILFHTHAHASAASKKIKKVESKADDYWDGFSKWTNK